VTSAAPAVAIVAVVVVAMLVAVAGRIRGRLFVGRRLLIVRRIIGWRLLLRRISRRLLIR
jgi:hypothetical protein